MNLVLEPGEFRLLDRMRLNPRKPFAGRIRGERLTRKKGVSIEFADYREYSEGNDLRHLDWNVLARLDTPVMRTYQDEEDLAVHLLLDPSASMDFGEPTKFAMAKRLACAMGYAALIGGDAVIPHAIGVREAARRPLRGRVSYPAFVRWVEELSISPTSDRTLTAALRAFTNSPARTGMVILISDGMDPEVETGLRMLAARGHDVNFIQILSDAEIDPDIEGDLKLLDAEGQATVEITANRLVLREYRRRLDAHNNGIALAVRKVGGRHTLVRPSQPLTDLIRGVLTREEWLVA